MVGVVGIAGATGGCPGNPLGTGNGAAEIGPGTVSMAGTAVGAIGTTGPATTGIVGDAGATGIVVPGTDAPGIGGNGGGGAIPGAVPIPGFTNTACSCALFIPTSSTTGVTLPSFDHFLTFALTRPAYGLGLLLFIAGSGSWTTVANAILPEMAANVCNKS